MSGTITMTGEEYDAMAGELDRVNRELSCLQSVIAEPDELNAEPASDYETLRRQYLSLRLLTNSALARNRYLCRRDDRDMRAALSVNAANVSAERDTNAMLTDLLEKAEAERDALAAEFEALRAQRNKMAENHNSILVTEVCPESRSVEEHIIDADSVRALWRLMRGYREQIEALRAENGHWKGMHASSMAMRMSAEFERDELRTELNEALGLLRELRAFTLDHDD
jgi:hypothetical protein